MVKYAGPVEDVGKTPRTPLNAVRAFESAARLLSYTKAAEELGVTQGAVSRQIATLERYLGRQLFRRVGRGIELTYTGAQFSQEARRALAGLESAVARIMRRPDSAVLTIGATNDASRWLVRRLTEFQRAHRSVSVHLRVIDSTADMHGGGVDIAVLGEPAPSPSLSMVEILREDLVIVCGPDLTPPRKASALTGETLLHIVLYPNAWADWFAAVGIQNADSQLGPLYDEPSLAIEAAIQGQGYAIAPKPAVEADLAAGRLISPYGGAVASGRSYYLVWPKAKDRLEKVRLFRSFMMNGAV
ncbi:MAG: LysR family transcriptional regulator [Alphaproteobacteria bacterium]|nr:LysR family transcriptional regulator [Alphaproteobacteria bacterium]